ncbi:hypothetical protein M0R45_003647 [Rubus argutus]|uniref:Stress-response A/B barrel domain-containing protein n=1 Tax=Rubus argutus TaxID=59490 RepID=A0AAW1YIN5_RUBAR
MTMTLCPKVTRTFLNLGTLSPPKRLLTRTTTIRMSSSSAVIEHIVLFKVKDNTDPSKILPFAFTHLLQSRYKTKDDLAAYSAHPNHLSVVKESVLPICDDVMAVDWVSEGLTGPLGPSPGSAIRVTFLKLKGNLGEAAKGEILEVINGIKGRFVVRRWSRCSVGDNFSPARAKGRSGDLEMEKDKVREYLESVIVLDYVVPSPQSASL